MGVQYCSDPGVDTCNDPDCDWGGSWSTQSGPAGVPDTSEAVSSDGIDPSVDWSSGTSVMRVLCRMNAGAASTTLAMEKIRRIRAKILS